MSINPIKGFVGQTKLVQTLDFISNSASKRNKQMDHMLFWGKRGLGKTTLAKKMAKSINDNKFKEINGRLLVNKADLLSLFSSISNGDFIIIKDFEHISGNLSSLMHSAMEDNIIDVLIGPVGDQKIMRMKLPKFTIIGISTEKDRIPTHLQNQFGFLARLTDYSMEDLTKIVDQILEKDKIKAKPEVIKKLFYLIRIQSKYQRIFQRLLILILQMN